MSASWRAHCRWPGWVCLASLSSERDSEKPLWRQDAVILVIEAHQPRRQPLHATPLPPSRLFAAKDDAPQELHAINNGVPEPFAWFKFRVSRFVDPNAV